MTTTAGADESDGAREVRTGAPRITRLPYAALLFSIVFFLCATASQCQTTTPAEITGPQTALSPGPAPAPEAPETRPLQPITAEMILRAILILFLFIAIAASIALRKIPAMVALPIMAFGIGILAGIPLTGENGILAAVIEGQTAPVPSGSFRMYQAIIYILFGGMFARFLSDARIAERIIKYAAEFGGEDPFFISLIMSFVTALIFTTIGGLPAIIMLGTVMFPILLSLGVPPAVCGSMMLLAFPIGASLNPVNLASLSVLFDVPTPTVWKFFGIWAGVQTVGLLTFLSVEFLRMKRTTVTPASILRSLAMILAAAAVALFIGFGKGEALDLLRRYGWIALQVIVGAMLIVGIVKTQFDYWVRKRTDGNWNMLSPILPLVFVLLFGLKEAIIPAFLASIAYAFFTTPHERGMQRLGKSIMDGVSDVAAPAVLMLGIGMLIAAATHSKVDGVLTPILAQVVPEKPLTYVIFFLLASPLTLYRGPLNTYGLGAGIAKLMQNIISPGATMGALQSVGMLQDPTTTQNVWICGYLKLPINALLFKLFFYSLGLCLAGLTLSAFLFF